MNPPMAIMPATTPTAVAKSPANEAIGNILPTLRGDGTQPTQ